MQDPGGKFYFGSPPVVSDPCQSVLWLLIKVMDKCPLIS
jgi:hypothetical protein